MFDQIAQLARLGNHRVAPLVQLRELLFYGRSPCGDRRPRFTEESHEGAINRIGCSITVRMDTDTRVWTVRPMLAPLGVHSICFSAEIADFAQCQFAPPLAVLNLHWNIVPCRMRQAQSATVGVNDFLSNRFPPPQIRAEKSTPSGGDLSVAGGAQPEFKPIT